MGFNMDGVDPRNIDVTVGLQDIVKRGVVWRHNVIEELHRASEHMPAIVRRASTHVRVF